MSVPRFLPARLDQYTLSATSTDSAFPLANLQTYFAADQWKSNSLAANQSLVIDFTSARACNFAIIENHNFSATGGTGNIYLQGADDSGFTTNAVNAVTDMDTAESPKLFTFGSISRRYWRIYFDSTNPLAVKPALGNFFLGTALDFTSEYSYPYRIADPAYQTSKIRALSGAIRTSQPYAARLVFEIQFQLQDAAFRTNWLAFLSTVRGDLRPFYFLDADGTTLYYVHLVNPANPIDVIRYGLTEPQKIQLETQQAIY